MLFNLEFINKYLKTIVVYLASILLFVAPPSYGEDQVLIIGIDDYKFIDPKLEGSVNDAKNIEKLVVDTLHFKKTQITSLLNSKATKDNIINTIKTMLIQKTKAGDRVLFYYSGHGDQIKDESGDEKDNYDETLVAVDASLSGEMIKNMVTDDEIKKLFDQITDRHVMIIVDSCHSGTITKGIKKIKKGLFKTPYRIRPMSKGISAITKSKEYQQHRKEESFIPSATNRIVWTAVGAAQLAFVDQKVSPPQGLFTHWFIDGVVNKNADKNKDSIVSNAELLNYTRKKSNEYCEYIPNCRNGFGVTPSFEAPLDKLSAPFISSLKQISYSKTIGITSNSLPEKDTKSIRISLETEVENKDISIGDKLFIAIKSTKPGFLLLLDQNSKGELRQIFPNKFQQNNVISAGKNIFIPNSNNNVSYVIKATELGKSELIAVITHDKLELDDLINANNNLKTISTMKNYISLLTKHLQAIWTGDKTNRQLNYSLAKYQYTVSKAHK